MNSILLRIFKIVLFVAFLGINCIVVGCDSSDSKNLFEYSSSLAALSRDGETRLWELNESQDGISVTILESFYNASNIYIGYVVTGQTKFDHDLVPVFTFEGKPIGNGGSHGGRIRKEDYSPEKRYYIMSPDATETEIASLPDAFLLDFIVLDQEGEREFRFEIPLVRSEKTS